MIELPEFRTQVSADGDIREVILPEAAFFEMVDRMMELEALLAGALPESEPDAPNFNEIKEPMRRF